MPGNFSAWIILFSDDVSEDDITDYANKIRAHGGNVTHEFTLIKGLGVILPEDYLLTLQQEVRDSGPIIAIEEDRKVGAFNDTLPW